MKKNLVYIFGLILTLTLFSVTYSKVNAISGACSSHSGVNCQIGSSSTGNAICNDGWESSTSYYDTDECKNNYKCPIYLDNENYNYFKTQYENLVNKSQENYNAYCTNIPPGSFSDSDSIDVWSRTCTTMINQITDEELKLSCLKPESVKIKQNDQICKSLDLYSYYNAGTFSCQCSYGSDDISGKCITQDALQTTHCKQSHGSSTVFVNGACVCASGYKMDSQLQCVPLEIKNIKKNTYDVAKTVSCSILIDEKEKSICIDYQLHSDLYNWVVSNTYKDEEEFQSLPKIIDSTSSEPVNIPNKPIIPTPKKKQIKSTESTSSTSNKNTLKRATSTPIKTQKKLLIATTTVQSTTKIKIKMPIKPSIFKKINSWFRGLFR